ncbi:MAG TPA: hypothetical protein VGG57_15955 [Stellaceae bacterium]|jgi:cytoskeletal protein CcmA (bactofilin family)
MFGRVAGAGLLLATLLAGTATAAQSPYDDLSTAAGWAWQQIRNDDVADFAERTPPGKTTPCGALDPQKENADDACHRLPSSFIVDALTDPTLRAQIGRHGFRLRNAIVDGDIDLEDGEISPEVGFQASRIEGSLQLGDSRWQHLLWLHSTTVTHDMDAHRTSFRSGLYLRGKTLVQGTLNVEGSEVNGDLDLSDSSLNAFDGGAVTVHGQLILLNAQIGNNDKNANAVYLAAANIGSDVNAEGVSVSGKFSLNHAHIKGSLFLRNNGKFLGEVNLVDVSLGSVLVSTGSSFLDKVFAERLTSAGSVFIDRTLFADTVDLIGSDIGGAIYGNASSFGGPAYFASVKVKTDVVLGDKAAFAGPLDMAGATIAGELVLDTSTFVDVRLSRADIGELGVNKLGWRCPSPEPAEDAAGSTPPSAPPPAAPQPLPAHWPLGAATGDARCNGEPGPRFALRNTHVGTFQDSADAWPPVLDLEGFHYDRLGGASASATDDMRRRSTDEWLDWLQRDPVFSTQPYAQLSTVLAAAGHRDKAEDIQYAGRERERHQSESWRDWTWLTFLWLVSGYGIGVHTFFAAAWVAGLTVVGALMLLISPQARAHGWAWRFGASLHRLLPVIELSKDFTDFFDTLPKQEIAPSRRGRLLQAYFAGHAITGYILGFFLIAAMGGLTQK